ncbi:MAG: hypothetical protein ABSF46_31360 [Terriglobia bacterium]|jgi:hypothetical protein
MSCRVSDGESTLGASKVYIKTGANSATAVAGDSSTTTACQAIRECYFGLNRQAIRNVT